MVLIATAMFVVCCAGFAQQPGGDESLYFQATMADEKMQALSGLTYAFGPDSSIGIVFAAAKANVKLADIKAVTFDWQTNKAAVRLQNDKEFTVTVESVRFDSRGMVFKGVPLNVPFDAKQIKSLVRVEAPTAAPKVALPPDRGRYVTCSDEAASADAAAGTASSPLLIGFTDNRGNYSPVQYAFTGVGAGAAVLSLPVSVHEGRKMLLPVYYVESLTVDKDGKAQIKLVNGQIVEETIPDLADDGPGKRFYGIYQGRAFARTASTKWRQAKFTWGPVPESLPSPKADAGGFEGRWYEVSGVDLKPGVLVARFLDKDGKPVQWGAVVSRNNGLEVDVVSGMGDGASLELKPQDKQIEITAGDQTLQAAPENVPVAMIGYVWTASKVPVRVAGLLDHVASMRPAQPPAGAADAEKTETAFADAAERARPVVWVVEDQGGNEWTVRDLGGHQRGEDYDDPPEGFVYSGGHYYVEDALLGGGLVAVGHGDFTLHLPCSLVEKVDAVNGRATFTEAILGKTELPLRGFAGIKSIGDDVDNFVLADEAKRKTLTLSGWLPDGGLLLIPVDHVASITRLAKGETPPVFQEEPKALGYAGTLKIRTADGEVEFTGAKIRYTLTGSPEDARTAARWLAVAKDEADDDPDKISVERAIVETKEGPTLPVELNRVESITKTGDSFTVKLSDKAIVGSLAPCQIVGEGPFGEMTVDSDKILEITVVR